MSFVDYDIEARVRECLPPLDALLRDAAVQAVVARVHALSGEAIEDDALLAVMLARVARAATTQREQSLPARAAEPSAAFSDRALSEQADRVDQALIALAAATGLVREFPDGRGSQGRLDAETLLEIVNELSKPNHDRLIRERALQLGKATVLALPRVERQLALGVDGLRHLRSLALGQGARTFVQAAAVELLASALQGETFEIYLQLLEDRETREAMIVRHRVLKCITSTQLSEAHRWQLFELAQSDPSEHVRQGLAEALAATPSPEALDLLLKLVEGDASIRVQGFALLQLEVATRETPEAWPLMRRALCFALSGPVLLCRAGLHALALRAGHEPLLTLDDALVQGLEQAVQTRPIDLAEQAALLARQLQLQLLPHLSPLNETLGGCINRLQEGQRAKLQLPERATSAEVERVLCVHGAVDLPVSLRYRSASQVLVQRGERRRSRWWRLRHELLHPAPDKRQNYLHARARTDAGDLASVPLRMAEVTPTRVPGERRTALGHSWCGFVPRVDDVLFTCDTGRARRLLSVFGTLVITPPAGWIRRGWLRLVLQWRYAKLAQQRERSLLAHHAADRKQFAQEIARLGFTCHWEHTQLDLGEQQLRLLPESVQVYFAATPLLAWSALAGAAALPWLDLPLSVTLWVEDALQYVLMPKGNTAWHLALVVWALLTFMIARAAWVLSNFERARRQIPLSLGGWGSRGKSGTERLKAALFHAQHYDVISKTTGCEAMMIVARRGQPASELFLYRAYDKATIWEQARVVQYAQSLGAQVFLWECMALQPEFVNILNREWMKDPVTTITNAYPDHEDVMGPSGEDVARVIGQFIPKKGKVFCSEEQMLPLLRQAARDVGSNMVEVTALDADLLPRDLLDRFPYEEHPRNIALALRLAEHFGVERERALVDLADYVYPDLGVLKTFPVITHKQRRLRFSNGMSANERAGFLSNWERLGFATHKPDYKPEVLLMGVINNRADRVPRSRVFAEVFARDAVVDAIAIIGTNQSGLVRFLSEAVREHAQTFELPQDPNGVAETLDLAWDQLSAPRELPTVLWRLHAVARQVTPGPSELSGSPAVDVLCAQLQGLLADAPCAVPQLHEKVGAWIAACATGLLASASLQSSWAWSAESPGYQQELETALGRVVLGWAERVNLRPHLQHLVAQGKREQAQAELERYYHASFMRKVHVLEDSSSSGDQVIDFLAKQLVPGLLTELMGCQNIKGTGLDFVYRFMSIDRVATWLDALRERPEERAHTLTRLLAHGDYGLFDVQLTLSFLQTELESDAADWTDVQMEAQRLQAHLLGLQAHFSARLSVQQKRTLWGNICAAVEPWFDHLDAVSRYSGAVKTMKELSAGRIPQATAVERLRELMARQKGGWLQQDAARLGKRLLRQRKDRAS